MRNILLRIKKILFSTTKTAFYLFICYWIFERILEQMIRGEFPLKSGYLIVTILYGFVLYAVSIWNIEVVILILPIDKIKK